MKLIQSLDLKFRFFKQTNFGQTQAALKKQNLRVCFKKPSSASQKFPLV